MTSDLLAGFLSGAVLIMAIGAQNAFILRQGISGGPVFAVVLVCAGADALLIAAGIAGLGGLVQSAPVALQLARYGGAAFLAAYGARAAWRVLRPHSLLVEAGTRPSLSAAMATCLAFTFLNPHVYLDTVVLLGSLAQQRSAQGRWVFGAGAAAASCTWFFALGFAARLLAPLFRQAIAWRVLDSLIALTMWGLSASLLMA